ncbi:serine/threonine protein phosphatase [Cenarchaeum symbiosum A]|uniref:Serine/threonine protein phosphatase n=1 Tax=Cenarchaeum symbiosum (strain A) TaxID=414004 RepID=A0RTM2_CENSY|nr:serine/threonine protein phosphatase [Cenarchaeum symbiosum A]
MDERAIGMLTDRGRVKDANEDSIKAIDIYPEAGCGPFKFLIVADGMGGHATGDVASRMAVDSIFHAVQSRLSKGTPPASALKESIQEANQKLLEYAGRNPESAGMGTTAVCALVKDRDVHVANIGDSRAYVINNEGIRQVTRDHSYVQELVDKGSITEEEARSHPAKNVITKAIGIAAVAEPDMITLTMDDGESLLLCCDGVIAHLEDDEIREFMRGSGPQEACKRIVDTANKRGGTDNISLIAFSPMRSGPQDRA